MPQPSDLNRNIQFSLPFNIKFQGLAMHDKPKESDWKHFKALNEVVLQRLAQQALDSIQSIATSEDRSPYDRYQAMVAETKDWDEKFRIGFGQFSRSRMLMQIGYLRSLQLVHDDELAGFSSDVQTWVANLVGGE